jgi:protein-histidine pros-kinase
MNQNTQATLTPKPDRKIHFTFGLIFFLLLVLFGLFFSYIQQAESVSQSDKDSYVHLDYTDILTINLLNLETQIQAVLLSPSDYSITAFNQAIIKLASLINSLEKGWSHYLKDEQITSLEDDLEHVLTQLIALTKADFITTPSAHDELQAVQAEITIVKDRIFDIRNEIRAVINKDQTTSFKALQILKLIMLGLALISFSFLFITYRETRNQQQMAYKHAEEITQQNNQLELAVHKRTEELFDLASHVTTQSENEKKRIASELHDELGALLTAAKMDASWVKRKLKEHGDDTLLSRLTRLIDNINASIHVKRAVTSSLTPPLLRELGLLEALSALTDDFFIDSDTKVQLELPDLLPPLSADLELALYRISQESLNNVRKYANASTVLVRLFVENQHIELIISDNGVGFDHASLKKGSHGLVGMRSRANMFKGQFAIDSNPNLGTTIKAKIPLKDPSEH